MLRTYDTFIMQSQRSVTFFMVVDHATGTHVNCQDSSQHIEVSERW